jgi:hypothetical protein
MKLLLAVTLGASLLASAACAADLSNIDPKASVPLAPHAADHAPGSCHFRLAANGMKLPDPACTPGAINPTLTLEVLTNPAFRTGMVRDKITNEKAKEIVYVWYGVAKPKNNAGPNQICELDHNLDIGAGGADTLDNIWPQCGDPNVPIGEREFKTKDRFAEHSLIATIKHGAAGDLLELQKRMAADWTQFLPTGH